MASPFLGAPLASYQTRYNDAALDPFQGEYTASFGPYAISEDPVIFHETARSLHDRVLASSSQGLPSGFLLLHEAPEQDSGSIIRMYHKVFSFSARLGLPATAWDGRSFAFHGDVVRNQISTVNWGERYYFALLEPIFVPTVATIDQALASDCTIEHFGPLTAESPSVEAARSRMTVVVPPKYMHIFLGGGLTPREAWERLRGAIVADGIEHACQPLIKWLQMAFTHSTISLNLAPISPLESGPPSSPMGDAFLIDHQQTVLERDLPGLNPSSFSEGASLIAQNMVTLVAYNKLARQGEENRRAAALLTTPDMLY
jgi:hypothetical protein